MARSEIEKIYQQELGRAPDKEGLDFYTQKAEESGIDQIRSEIAASSEAQAFEESGTARTVDADDRITDGSVTYRDSPSSSSSGSSGGSSASNSRDQISDIYQDELGRNPDRGGLSYWQDEADAKGFDFVRDAIANSPEASLFDQTNNPIRVAAADQAEGFDYRTDDTLVQYNDTDYGGRLSDYFESRLDAGKISQSTNNQGQTVYQTSTGGQYTLDAVAQSPSAPDLPGPGDLGVGDRGVPRTEVTPEQTAQGQLANILDSDSPLMQRAATQGAQAANSRGLLNSSMASQAAQGAMIDRATPIASQDAETYFQNAQANAGREQQDYMQRLGFEQDLASAAQRYEIDSALLEQEGNQAMERLYGTSLANAWGVMGNNVTDIVAQSLANIQAIQNNPNIEPESKTEMIRDILDMRDQDVEFQAELYATLPGTLQDTGVFPATVG